MDFPSYSISKIPTSDCLIVFQGQVLKVPSNTSLSTDTLFCRAVLFESRSGERFPQSPSLFFLLFYSSLLLLSSSSLLLFFITPSPLSPRQRPQHRVVASPHHHPRLVTPALHFLQLYSICSGSPVLDAILVSDS